METPARLNDLQRTTLAIVLAGGRGTRLGPLTNKRVKPAVHFGGKYRIIDFALSNCLNSGIRRIAVVTQYKAHSLLRHLQRGWGFLRGEMGEFIDLWPAQQRVEGAHWYRGTADAVFQNLDIIRSIRPKYVVVLAGDHIYKMDYTRMIADHATASGVKLDHAVRSPRQTTLAFVRIVGGESQYAFYDAETASAHWRYLAGSIPFAAVDAVHIGSTTLVHERGAAQVRALVADARDTVTISFDPNCRPDLVEDREAYRTRMNAFADSADLVKMSDVDFDYLYESTAYAVRAEAMLARGTSSVGAPSASAACAESSAARPP